MVSEGIYWTSGGEKWQVLMPTLFRLCSSNGIHGSTPFSVVLCTAYHGHARIHYAFQIYFLSFCLENIRLSITFRCLLHASLFQEMSGVPSCVLMCMAVWALGSLMTGILSHPWASPSADFPEGQPSPLYTESFSLHLCLCLSFSLWAARHFSCITWILFTCVLLDSERRKL